MATLAQIREQIIRRVSGGNQSADSQIDPREIDLLITQELNAAIKIEYFTNIKAEDVHGVSGQYLASYTLDVKKDTIRGEQYVELTQPFVTLPHDKGIQDVTPLNGKCKTFIPVNVGSRSIYQDLPAGNLETKAGFYVERNRIYFTTDIMCRGTSKVRVREVVAAGSDMVIDPAIESALIRSVIAIIFPQMSQDKVADNVDNTAINNETLVRGPQQG